MRLIRAWMFILLGLTSATILADEPTLTPSPEVFDCAGNQVNVATLWTIVDEEGEVELCEVATHKQFGVLPADYGWLDYNGGNPNFPVSPDGRYVLLEGSTNGGWDYFSYDTTTQDVLSLGTIPYESMAIGTPVGSYVFWLSDTRGAFTYGPSPESQGKTLFSLEVNVENSIQALSRGWFYDRYENPPRIEVLRSGEWLSWKTGSMYPDDYPCTFEILDADGYRKYELGDRCKVEIGADGGEPTIWYEGEIEHFGLTPVTILADKPTPTAIPEVFDCVGNKLYDNPLWVLVEKDSKAQLCEVATLTTHDVLPPDYSWLSNRPNPNLPVSPDGRYILLEGGTLLPRSQSGWEYFSYNTVTESLLPLGVIPQALMSMGFPPLGSDAFWLSNSRAGFTYGASPESISKTLFSLQANVENSLEAVATGWFYDTYDNPPRFENMVSVEWLRWKTGYAYPDDAPPCTFEILDADGYRKYELGDRCQVEIGTEEGFGDQVHSYDGKNLIYLRDIDLENGIAQIVHQPIGADGGEPTIWYEGEIEYLLSNSDGEAIALVGSDGVLVPDQGTSQFLDLASFNATSIIYVTGPNEVREVACGEDGC